MKEIVRLFRQQIRALHSTLLIFRVYNTRSMILFYLVGVSLGDGIRLSRDLFLVPLIFLCTYSFASILNFQADQEIDRINKRTNPFLNKQVNTYFDRSALFILPAGAIALSLYTNSWLSTFLGSVFLLVLSYGYSHSSLRWSHHPLLKIIAMALNYAIVPALIGLGMQNVTIRTFIILVSLSVFYTSWLLYSDMKDIRGDQKFNKRTFAVLLGKKKLATWCWGIGLMSFLFVMAILMRTYSIHRVTIIVGILTIGLQFIAMVNIRLLENKRLRILGSYIVYIFLISLLVDLS